MSETNEFWATDALVSFPEPPPASAPVLESFGGVGFTMNGLAHDMNPADLEEMMTPMFAPEGYRGSIPPAEVK